MIFVSFVFKILLNIDMSPPVGEAPQNYTYTQHSGRWGFLYVPKPTSAQVLETHSSAGLLCQCLLRHIP